MSTETEKDLYEIDFTNVKQHQARAGLVDMDLKAQEAVVRRILTEVVKESGEDWESLAVGLMIKAADREEEMAMLQSTLVSLLMVTGPVLAKKYAVQPEKYVLRIKDESESYVRIELVK